MLRRRNTALQTDTPTFKRWFGASKVVDERGQPLVVYHGSPKRFDTFVRPDIAAILKDEYADEDEQNQGMGIYFTDSAENAATYGREVYPVYLRMLNPLIVDAQGENWSYVPFKGSFYYADDIVSIAEGKGHDGVVFLNIYDSKSANGILSNTYIVFDPKQIKSATDNAGTFALDDPSMLRNPRRRNPRAWHGSARALQQFRAPAFFADDRKAARWFAVERAGAEPGVLMEVELDIRHPATSADLIRAAKAVGVAVVESPYFEAPEISRYAAYDGSNPLDLVYIPKVRAELLKRGFDGVRGWDLLEADEIEVWITLRDDQATVVSTHRANPHRRTRR